MLQYVINSIKSLIKTSAWLNAMVYTTQFMGHVQQMKKTKIKLM
jgi:hypothetical protein